MTVYHPVVRRQARKISTPDRVDVARDIVATHRGTAPVDDGTFRDGAAVWQAGDDVSVINRDPTAKFKEYGTEDTPAHGTMTNAARRYGRYTGWKP